MVEHRRSGHVIHIKSHNLRAGSFRRTMVFMYKIETLPPPALQVGQRWQHALIHNTNVIVFNLLLYITYTCNILFLIITWPSAIKLLQLGLTALVRYFNPIQLRIKHAPQLQRLRWIECAFIQREKVEGFQAGVRSNFLRMSLSK